MEAGIDPWSFSLRELMAGVKAKRRQEWERGRQEWERTLFLAEVVANSQPRNKGDRSVVRLRHLNPYRRGRNKSSRGIPLKGDLGEKALDACSVEAK